MEMLGPQLTTFLGNTDNPEPWDFRKHPSADLVVINIGTNDANSHNNVSNTTYVESYKQLIAGIHGVWPEAQVIVMVWRHPFSVPQSLTRQLLVIVAGVVPI